MDEKTFEEKRIEMIVYKIKSVSENIFGNGFFVEINVWMLESVMGSVFVFLKRFSNDRIYFHRTNYFDIMFHKISLQVKNTSMGNLNLNARFV